MRSATSERDLLPALDALVREHAAEIFDEAGDDFAALELTITGRLHEHGDRHHRVLTVRDASAPAIRSKRVWLKFRTDFRELYDIHRRAWADTRDAPLFPKPYFHATLTSGDVIAMELLEGQPLRELLLLRAARRSARSLNGVFTDLGARLRTFHDASAPTASKLVGELAANARQLCEHTPYLGESERGQVVEQIGAAASRAGADTALPLVKIHHDCSLRNIVVTEGGSPRLLDLDSMRASVDSRWYDVTTLLINLESQVKYNPIVSAGAVAPAWSAFWAGYVAPGRPDGLSSDAIRALLYLTKVEYLLGGTFRPPLFEVYTGRIAARYVRRLKRTVVAGKPFAYGDAWGSV